MPGVSRSSSSSLSRAEMCVRHFKRTSDLILVLYGSDFQLHMYLIDDWIHVAHRIKLPRASWKSILSSDKAGNPYNNNVVDVITIKTTTTAKIIRPGLNMFDAAAC